MPLYCNMCISENHFVYSTVCASIPSLLLINVMLTQHSSSASMKLVIVVKRKREILTICQGDNRKYG